jgi:hypothetical protein
MPEGVSFNYIRVLRRVSGNRRKEVTGNWRKLHNV